MGAVGSFLGKKDPVLTVVENLREKLLDRDELLDVYDACYRLLNPRVGSGKYTQVHFFRNKGCDCFKAAIDYWKDDEVLLRSVVRCVIPLARNPKLADELRKCGIRTYMENVLDGNKLDDIIQRDGNRALSAVNEAGTRLAMQIIEDGSTSENPRLVIQAMVEHPRKSEVHEAALDVLWEMTKQDAKIPEIIAHNGHIVITDTIKRFPAHTNVQTKGFGTVAGLGKNLTACSLLGKQEVIKLAVRAYNKFENNFQVQQQVLWALDSLARLPNNVERMDRDGLKVILRVLAKEHKQRKEAKGSDKEKRMIWRLVPVRLKKAWTRTELVEDYTPSKPGEDEDEDDGDPAHYDVNLKDAVVNYTDVKWETIDLYPA